MVLRIHWEQEHQSCEKRSQKKPDDRACELLAEKAACLVSLADEFCSEHPITMETVQKKILDEWSSGCKRIDMELAAQLLEKSESFAIAIHSFSCAGVFFPRGRGSFLDVVVVV